MVFRDPLLVILYFTKFHTRAVKSVYTTSFAHITRYHTDIIFTYIGFAWFCLNYICETHPFYSISTIL